MYVDDLLSKGGVPPVPASIIDLVSHVGKASFARRMYNEIYAISGCEHLTGFAFPIAGNPTPILTEDRGGTASARGCAQSYVNAFWRNDPVNSIQRSEAGSRYLASTDISDIGLIDYRRACYTDVNLALRVTLVQNDSEMQFRLNIYKPAHSGFSDRSVDALEASSPLLLALLRRHHEDQAVDTPLHRPQDFIERLSLLAPGLTRREAEVCAGIAFGQTSEGIAIELGIGMNTVLTYRKRAYSRLNITSQNELLRLIMH